VGSGHVALKHMGILDHVVGDFCGTVFRVLSCRQHWRIAPGIGDWDTSTA
jgi:hypothetical protein